MAVSGLKESAAGYYPPRSRWYTRLFLDSWQPVRRRFGIEGLHLPARLPPLQLLASLVLPGFSLFAQGRRTLGWLFITGYCLAAILFVVGMGYLAGNIGFGILISVHASSILFLEVDLFRESRLATRLALGLCTLAVVWGLIYEPILHCVERNWIVPMRIGNKVMIVQSGVPPKSLRRGDLVAFEITGTRFSGGHENRLMLSEGLCLSQVLALAGDEVQFSNRTIFVNGVARPGAPHMPADGGFVVPEKVWFIWPDMDISQYRVAEGNISAAMQEAGMVRQNQIIGRAFKSWCGRRQLP